MGVELYELYFCADCCGGQFIVVLFDCDVCDLFGIFLDFVAWCDCV